MIQAKLGELLVKSKLLRPEQLDVALAEQKKRGGKLGEILVRLNFVSEEDVTAALGEQLHLPTVQIDDRTQVPETVLERIPAALARSYLVLPLELTEQQRVLVVACADAIRGARLDELRVASRCWIMPRLAPRSALVRAIDRHYGANPNVEAGAERKRADHAVVKTRPSQREVRAMVELLIEKGFITRDEYAAKLKD